MNFVVEFRVNESASPTHKLRDVNEVLNFTLISSLSTPPSFFPSLIFNQFYLSRIRFSVIILFFIKNERGNEKSQKRSRFISVKVSALLWELNELCET